MQLDFNDQTSECLRNVTFILHTRNRPDFLLRALDYYDYELGCFKARIIISDASDDSEYEVIKKSLGEKKYQIDVHLLHSPSNCSLSIRLNEVLNVVDTPYVMLAADDDLYFTGWIPSAVSLMEGDVSYGTVYGHTLKFGLEQYAPFGAVVDAAIAEYRNPPIRWLEGHSPEGRLTSLGRSDWATVGWYALQRKKLLQIIVESAIRYDIDGYLFEKLLVFCQAALFKTRKCDHIYLARQNDTKRREPFSFKHNRNAIDEFLRAASAILSQHGGVDGVNADRIVRSAFDGEILQYMRADKKQRLRRWLGSVPSLQGLWYRLRARRLSDSEFEQDPNLPIFCNESLLRHHVDILTKVVHRLGS
ncbi:TIGR00180 family glycosyltransferase [uncultured Thiodictyon sp.]|uniref:TIGR00180 family glycosyltransferase n=1 Tax=uncultured Thiodictyon sp. TaxID=1846217 RepID=UPI0025F28594|nr:TIGR00180 family glycosyltransferase [uncultured Thiodictyon sp.]